MLVIRVSYFMLAILSILQIISAGCTRNDRNPVGSQLPDEDWFGEGPFIDTLSTDDELTVMMREGAGASPFLVVGSHSELVSRSLIRFLILPSADSVLAARLEFRVHDLIGTDALTVSVYRLTNSDWVEAETTWDLVSGKEGEDPLSWETPGGDFDGGAPLSSAEVTTSLIDSTFTVELEPALISSWIDSTAENAGLILALENEGSYPGLVEFRSRQMASAEEFLGPQLYVKYTKAEDPDSVVEGTIVVTEDATIYRYDGEVPGGSLRVGSVPQFRTFIRFDTSIFSKATSVRRATLFLPIIEKAPRERDFTVGAYMITGDWDADLTPLNFTPLDTVEIGEQDTVALDVTDIAWGWVSGTIENNGVSIKASVERGMFGYVDIEGGSVGKDRGPLCIVEYSQPPSVNRGSKERAR